MTDRFYVERKGVRPSEAIIDRKELERLRVMARRAADYEAAARSMRNAQTEVLERYRSDPTDKYAEGWLAAIRRFSELVVRGSER